VIKKLFVPLPGEVFAELYKPADLIVLDKVVAFGYITYSAADFRGKIG